MNAKFFLKLSAAFLLLLIFITSIGLYLAVVEVNRHYAELETLVQKEFQFPIRLGKIKVPYRWPFKIVVENLTIRDSETTSVPFAEIDSLYITPKLSRLLWDHKIEIKRVEIKKMHVMLGHTAEAGWALLNLNGEPINTVTQFKSHDSLLPLLFASERFVLKDLRVDLKTNKNINTLHCSRIILKTEGPAKNLDLRIDGKGWRFESLISLNEKTAVVGFGQLYDPLEIQDIFSNLKLDETYPEWLCWMKRALQKGELIEGELDISGPIDKLQFDGKLFFNDTDIDFDKDWPMLSAATGFLTLNNQKIEIILKSGRIFQTPIKALTASISSFINSSEPMLLDIQGKLDSHFATGLAFIKESPLQKKMSPLLDWLKPSGQFELDLGLSIPLDNINNPIKVNGKITTLDGQFTLPTFKLQAKNLQGMIHFTESTMKAEDLLAAVGWQDKLEERHFSIAMDALNSNQTRLQLVVKNLFGVTMVVPQNEITAAKVTSELKSVPLFVEELKFSGLHVQKTAIHLQLKSGNVISTNVDGPKIKGNIIFPSFEEHAYYFNLDYLKWISNDSKETKTFLSEHLIRAKKPTIHFKVNNLETEKFKLGSVSVELIPNQQGYVIQDLTFKAKDYKLTGAGNWKISNQGTENSTDLKGNFITSNIGITLERLDYNLPIREASGYIQYDLTWPEIPSAFSLLNASGAADIKLSKGRIIGADPGMSRIFGLMNIESITKRIKLDFSDLTRKGFVFDNMKGPINFEAGKAITQGLMISGLSARIAVQGEINLANKQIDIMMDVLPKVGQVGAPIVGGLIGGPIGLVGSVVTFGVLDTLTNSRFGVGKMSYHVTGTLASPQLERIMGDKKNPPQLDPNES